MKDDELSKMDRLLSFNDVAALLGVNERTVRRLVNRGEMVSVKFGACRRVLYSAVRRFIEQHVDGSRKLSQG